jgi:KRAB domain-containing zinc finger protein
MENPPKKIKLESENDFENSSESQQENFLTDQKVKKDPERNFLFLPFESPKMPKSIKREVMRKEIKCSRTSYFSKFQCNICEKYLINQDSLDRHTELHFQPSSFECKRCDKTWEIKGKFDAHKCLKKSERHFCNFCEKNFAYDCSLSTHIKKFHTDKMKVNWFCCDFCNEKFITKGYLKFHLESFQCRKIFTCDHCGKEFDKKVKILRHIRSHETHGKLECEICERKFSMRGDVNKHMKFHENPDQFKCQICGHQATQISNLKTHLKTHDKNREKKLKCDQCDFKTDYKHSLNYHSKRHVKKF